MSGEAPVKFSGALTKTITAGSTELSDVIKMNDKGPFNLLVKITAGGSHNDTASDVYIIPVSVDGTSMPVTVNHKFDKMTAVATHNAIAYTQLTPLRTSGTIALSMYAETACLPAMAVSVKNGSTGGAGTDIVVEVRVIYEDK